MHRRDDPWGQRRAPAASTTAVLFGTVTCLALSRAVYTHTHLYTQTHNSLTYITGLGNSINVNVSNSYDEPVNVDCSSQSGVVFAAITGII